MNRMNFNKMAADCVDLVDHTIMHYSSTDILGPTEALTQIIERALKLTYAKGFKKALKQAAEAVQLRMRDNSLSELAPEILEPLQEMEPFPAERVTRYNERKINSIKKGKKNGLRKTD